MQYGCEIIRFLIEKNVKAVVMACGSSSSVTFDDLSTHFPGLPIIDVIRPGVQFCAMQLPQNTRLGFIATTATVRSGLFSKQLQAIRPDITLYTRSCPLFAPMVEAGLRDNPITHWAAKTYVEDWKETIDALVLGCTHFPLLTDALSAALGPITFINLAESTALATAIKLNQSTAPSTANPTTHEYFVTGDPIPFNRIARFLLNRDITAAKIVMIS